MFTEDHKIFRQGLRDFLDREVMPNIDQWEEQQRMKHHATKVINAKPTLSK